MTNPDAGHGSESGIAPNLKRIQTISILALLLLLLLLLHDGPVSTLGWILAAALLLCIAFIITAATVSRNESLSTDRIDHDNDV